jgi:hypothetical protein
MDTKKDSDLGFLELSADELLDVTGACRPSWELFAQSDGNRTVVEARSGNEQFRVDTTGNVMFEERVAWTSPRSVQWKLDSGIHFALHTFDVDFFRA